VVSYVNSTLTILYWQIGKRLVDEGFHLDLLFYHRKLRRLIAIELKLGKFKAAYKGQMELYLRWLDKNDRASHEEIPLGIIMCSVKGKETVELLELDKSGIHVAEYLTELPPKDILVAKLERTIQEARDKNNTPQIEGCGIDGMEFKRHAQTICRPKAQKAGWTLAKRAFIPR